MRVPVTFHRAQNLNFWMQVYNLGIDEKSKQNGATIEYQILDMATNKAILQTQELTSKTNPNSDQVTIEKSLPLASLQPGKYQVNIKVNDGITKQQIAESAPFHCGLGRCERKTATWLCGFRLAITSTCAFCNDAPSFFRVRHTLEQPSTRRTALLCNDPR